MPEPTAPPAAYVAFDLETTGLSPQSDRIVEVGAIRFDASGLELDHFQSLVNPRRPCGPGARAVHGISDLELAQAEPAEVVLPRFVAFLGDPNTTTLLAHNAAFDAGFLGHELARLGLPMPGHAVVDTLALARARWPRAGSHRLETLARQLGLHAETAHRALADSRRVMGLWQAIQQDLALPSLPLAYPIFDARQPPPAPQGWGPIAEAIAADLPVHIEYSGGTRGPGLRLITPRRFSNRGGVAYLVALCHLDRKEKEFRLDRVVTFEIPDLVRPEAKPWPNCS
jgi:DNA polymerase III epsilon subunit family exonuclease